MPVKVPYDDLDIEWIDDIEFCTYDGEPFTGVITDIVKNPSLEGYPLYGEINCKNGYFEGRELYTYKNGELHSECLYEHGIEITRKHWRYDGVLVESFQAHPLFHRKYCNDGTLIYEKTEEHSKEWYNSGEIREEYIYKNKAAYYYAKDGTVVLRHKANGDNFLVMDVDSIEYNDEYIGKHYIELLNDCYSEFYPYFIRWLPKISDKSGFDEIICSLINSDNLRMKYDGINLSADYSVECAVPLLKKELNNCQYADPLQYAHTIAQRAEIALKHLT